MITICASDVVNAIQKKNTAQIPQINNRAKVYTREKNITENEDYSYMSL